MAPWANMSLIALPIELYEIVVGPYTSFFSGKVHTLPIFTKLCLYCSKFVSKKLYREGGVKGDWEEI